MYILLYVNYTSVKWVEENSDFSPNHCGLSNHNNVWLWSVRPWCVSAMTSQQRHICLGRGCCCGRGGGWAGHKVIGWPTRPAPFSALPGSHTFPDPAPARPCACLLGKSCPHTRADVTKLLCCFFLWWKALVQLGWDVFINLLSDMV